MEDLKLKFKNISALVKFFKGLKLDKTPKKLDKIEEHISSGAMAMTTKTTANIALALYKAILKNNQEQMLIKRDQLVKALNIKLDQIQISLDKLKENTTKKTTKTNKPRQTKKTNKPILFTMQGGYDRFESEEFEDSQENELIL